MQHDIHIPNIEEIKIHIKKHQMKYAVGVTAVVTAGVVYYIGYRSGSVKILSPKASIFGINNKLDQRVITLVDRQGPPSWIIGKVGTDEEWMSQGATAIAEGLRERDLRAHLNGLLDNVNGKKYYRKGLAAAA